MGSYIIIIFAFALILALLTFVAMYTFYEKADQPGIACIVPIWGQIVYYRIAGLSGWLILVDLFISTRNPLILLAVILFKLYVNHSIAEKFNVKSNMLFAIGLTFLPFIFIPIIAWGDSQYEGKRPMQQISNYDRL